MKYNLFCRSKQILKKEFEDSKEIERQSRLKKWYKDELMKQIEENRIKKNLIKKKEEMEKENLERKIMKYHKMKDNTLNKKFIYRENKDILDELKFYKHKNILVDSKNKKSTEWSHKKKTFDIDEPFNLGNQNPKYHHLIKEIQMEQYYCHGGRYEKVNDIKQRILQIKSLNDDLVNSWNERGNLFPLSCKTHFVKLDIGDIKKYKNNNSLNLKISL